MPYALFEDDQKLSQEFPTEEDVWQHADEAGLVDVVDGKTVLRTATLFSRAAPKRTRASRSRYRQQWPRNDFH